MNNEYGIEKTNTPCKPQRTELSDELLKIISTLKETRVHLTQARLSIDASDLTLQQNTQEPTCHYEAVAQILDLSIELQDLSGAIAFLLK